MAAEATAMAAEEDAEGAEEVGAGAGDSAAMAVATIIARATSLSLKEASMVAT